jgi:ATP-dependent protease HslVU (ClpYQ) peptidase subunit
MSVVAVRVEKDKITIGADSILVNGYTQEKDKQAKLFQNEWMVVGDVGEAQEGALFQIFSKTRKPREASNDGITEYLFDFFQWKREKTESTELVNSYIIVFGGKAFNVEGFYVKEITDYMAIGAGMDFALAALYLGSSVKDAIKTACHLSILCEEPINLIEIETNKIK